MIVLTGASEQLRLTTELSDVDVHASWVDGPDSAAPDRANTLIATATTTVVVDAPGGGVARAVKTLYARNRHATNACRMTFVHRKSGPTDVEVIRAVVPSNASLRYDDRRGWAIHRGINGSGRRFGVQVVPTAVIGEVHSSTLWTDVSNAHSTANTMVDVPVGFPVKETCTYWFQFFIPFTAAATTTASRFGLYGPGSPTLLVHRVTSSLTTQSLFFSEGRLTYDQAQLGLTSAATASNIAVIEGFITPSCDGTVFLRVASEISASEIRVIRHSTVHWERVL